MDTPTKQAKGPLGRLWYVTIDPGINGPVRVKVAGDTTAELLDRIWQGRLSGNRRMKPAASILFRLPVDLLAGITEIEPAPGRYVLHSERWTRYVVRVYCCDELVEVVAVKSRKLGKEDNPMKLVLWNNLGKHLPVTPSDSVSWDNFHPEVVSEEAAVEAKKSVRLIPLPKVTPLEFGGIYCPTCGSHNDASRQNCYNCGEPLREDTRSTHRVRASQTIEPEPSLIAL